MNVRINVLSLKWRLRYIWIIFIFCIVFLIDIDWIRFGISIVGGFIEFELLILLIVEGWIIIDILFEKDLFVILYFGLCVVKFIGVRSMYVRENICNKGLKRDIFWENSFFFKVKLIICVFIKFFNYCNYIRYFFFKWFFLKYNYSFI